MIVGTAGHIDHGKTTLVRALTGVDTDRLPEEKQRGISIELGYAFLDVPTIAADVIEPDAPELQRIGFIDVPGHERLVHTMLAGATGVDLALLLVAADDGPMPQTREHLAVLSLLGITRGAVVITKADRVDATRRAEVMADVRTLVAGSALVNAPTFCVSAVSGDGVASLRDWLFAEARSFTRETAAGRAFRLAIDRAFTIDGVGTVCTGTVHAGEVRIGDVLELAPSRADMALRVRSLHAQNKRVELARGGERCAVALAGAAKDDLARGQWLVESGATSVSARVDVELTVWQGETSSLRSGASLHVHVGAASVMASVAVLDAGDAIEPGATARAQLVLRQPVGLWRNDRVVLRDAAASRTIGGGKVLDPLAPTRYRRTPQRMAELDAMALPSVTERFSALLAVSENGLAIDQFWRVEGTRADAWPPSGLNLDSALVAQSADGQFALSGVRAAAASMKACDALCQYHLAHPEELGPDPSRLRRLALPRLNASLFDALLAQLIAAGAVTRRGAAIHLPEHGVRLSDADQRVAQQIAAPIDAARFEGAWIRDLARDCRIAESVLRGSVARLSQQGEVHQVVRDLLYSTAVMTELATIARALASEAEGTVTAAALRDATQLGRKRAIQILEYFDRVGLFRRVGDSHKLRTESQLFVTHEVS
jgi:selenocysteine-specific elongation factor